jgi:hypothetical protein
MGNDNPQAATTTTQQINQATTHIGTGLGLFGVLLGRYAPRLGNVTRFSPVHGANTRANIATTDTSSSTDCAVAMASSYAFAGQFLCRGAMRFAPGVGNALLVNDVAKLMGFDAMKELKDAMKELKSFGPAVMNQLDVRAKNGCTHSQSAVKNIREVAERVNIKVESAGQAYRVFEAKEAALPPFSQSSFCD